MTHLNYSYDKSHNSWLSELLHIAAETGLIEDPILPKLNEVQDLRVKLEKMKMRMGFAEESQEAKTNCTICEEMVSFERFQLGL